MTHFSKTVLRNFLFTGGAQIIIKIISFTFSVLVIRRLGPEVFGQYSAILAIGAVFMIFSDLGLSPYATRQVARLRSEENSEEHIRELYGNMLGLRIVLTFITACMQIGTAWLTGEPMIIIGAVALNCLGLFMYGIQGSTDSVLSGMERFDISARARVGQQILFVILGTAALFLHLSYYGLIGASICAILLLTIQCWHGLRSLGISPGHIQPQKWLKLLRVSLPFGVIGFTLGLSYKFDSLLIYHFRGDSENGLYTAAYNLIFSMAMISNVINTALYPSLSRQAAHDQSSLHHVYDRILRYLIITGLPIAVGGSILADHIILLLGGEAYRGAIDVFRILVLVSPLMFVSEYLGYIVLIRGEEKLAARSVVISTSVNVVANILLIPRYGMMAAAVITVITEAVLMGQYASVIYGKVHFNLKNSFVAPLIAAMLMGAVTLVLRDHVPFAITILLSACVYLPMLFVFQIIGQDEMHFLRSLRTRSEVRVP